MLVVFNDAECINIVVMCVCAVQSNSRQPVICVSNTLVRVRHAESDLLRNCCANSSLLYH